MITITNNPKELILLCDLVVTEIGCSRTRFCSPSNRQLACSKKQLQPIEIFIHITTVYKIPIDFNSIIGYYNSKMKGRYGNSISNKQTIKK